MKYSINHTLLKDIIHTDCFLIDLRDEYQFNRMHIQNFVNIPYHTFKNQTNLLPKDKPIYLICQSGRLAKTEAEKLILKNYQAYYIEGGINALLEPPPIYF